jgi:hypothetical protein
MTNKNLILTCLMAFLTLTVSAQDQQDMTKYITNPSFESGTTGWTVSDLQLQTNDAFSKRSGGMYIEKWTGKGGSVGDASARQTLTKLAMGVYRLTVGAQNMDENNKSRQCTGAYIFANDQKTTVYTPDDYSVEFTCISGEAEIGFVAEGATGNWLAFDNFRLYLIGQVDNSIVMAEVQRLITAAEALVIPEEIATTYQFTTQFTEALATARQLTENSEPALISTTINTLQHAIADEEVKIEKALFAYHVNNPTEGTGTAPKVTQTNHYVATGATQALMRATMTGSNLLERGVCWSTERNPTVLDERTTKYFSQKGMLFHVKGLKPATVYYLRPYAINKTYQVAYGDEVKIVTHPQGTCSWSWNGGAPNEAANARCRNAMKETIEYFNEWTGIKGFHLTGNYGAQTQTADCSYGGWMRIGPNAAYQAIGTVLHETGHGVGVGTHSRWSNCSDTRENTSWGKWLGRAANEVLQFLENNYNDGQVFFTGDKTHGWGSGEGISYDWLVNGADKDKHTEIQYIGGMCILHGLFIDGLCPTSGDPNGIAGYTYNFDNDKKYYLMNKNASFGLGTGVLYQRSSTSVVWKHNLTEATLSDSAAWRLEFIPTTGYYLFKNVATGRYLSHDTGISMRNLQKPTSSEYFQLMPDRTNVTIGKGSAAFATHGYWFTWQNEGSKAMSASAYNSGSGFGRLTQTDFNYSNSATAQQWIIISEDELADYQAAAVATAIRDIDAATATGSRQNTDVYDLQGRRVSNPTKGLYIINGRKAVFK